MTRRAQVRVARVYDSLAGLDGERILVDRIWPRGVKKTDLHLDGWPKELAPSTALRKWYGHEPERFEEFRRRYLTELGQPERAKVLDELRALAARRPLILLTATKDADHSQAVVLAALLQRTAVSPDESEPLPIEEGGDPACWLHLVCPRCGQIPDRGELCRCREDTATGSDTRQTPS